MSYYSGSNTFPSLKPGFHMALMETLPERQQTIRATETTLLAWIELSSIRTIGTIVKIMKRSCHMEALSDDWDDRDNRRKAIPEITTFIPVMENKFGLDGAQVVKIIQKCSHRVWRYSKLEEVCQVLDVNSSSLLLLASRRRQIERKIREQGTMFALRIKIIIMVVLFAKHAQKLYCFT